MHVFNFPTPVNPFTQKTKADIDQQANYLPFPCPIPSIPPKQSNNSTLHSIQKIAPAPPGCSKSDGNADARIEHTGRFRANKQPKGCGDHSQQSHKLFTPYPVILSKKICVNPCKSASNISYDTLCYFLLLLTKSIICGNLPLSHSQFRPSCIHN